MPIFWCGNGRGNGRGKLPELESVISLIDLFKTHQTSFKIFSFETLGILPTCWKVFKVSSICLTWLFNELSGNEMGGSLTFACVFSFNIGGMRLL